MTVTTFAVASLQVTLVILFWTVLRQLCYLKRSWPAVLGFVLAVPRVWAQAMIIQGYTWAGWQFFASKVFLVAVLLCLLLGIFGMLTETRRRVSVVRRGLCSPSR